jgi:hypothetical protein
MLCPCCGTEIQLDVRECNCGARFVGQPLDEKPVTIQGYGAVMNALGLLALVTVATLVLTKFFALGALLVVWSARRAMRLAKNQPERYGGFKVATATLLVTVVAGSVAAGFTISYIPRFMKNRKTRQDAATVASMRHLAALAEEYKQAHDSYPETKVLLEQFSKEPIPTDFWEQHIRYRGNPDKIASAPSTKRNGNKMPAAVLAISDFELRSNGPDGIADTADDIIMIDGIFYTFEESKKVISRKLLTVK